MPQALTGTPEASQGPFDEEAQDLTKLYSFIMFLCIFNILIRHRQVIDLLIYSMFKLEQHVCFYSQLLHKFECKLEIIINVLVYV